MSDKYTDKQRDMILTAKDSDGFDLILKSMKYSMFHSKGFLYVDGVRSFMKGDDKPCETHTSNGMNRGIKLFCEGWHDALTHKEIAEKSSEWVRH